jgi:hypothetical protein
VRNSEGEPTHSSALLQLTIHLSRDVKADFATSYFVNIITVYDSNIAYFLDLQEDFIIDVHMAVDDASEAVARGTAHFSEVFKFPQKKIHITVPLVGTGTQEAIVGFGVIECWFQLCCSVGLISSYMQHRTANKVIQLRL